MKRLSVFILTILLLILFSLNFTWAGVQEDLRRTIEAHPGKSGAYVLEKGEEALFARACLTEEALNRIDVQYFIWSTDNTGILAAEALLRAADRGVEIRVIVDDLLVDAPDESLLALAAHPKVNIRIYNPLHKVGTSKLRRFANIVFNFRGVNQRMHDKTFIADQKVAIIGGRNMADEYYDFDQGYNFRDRDIMLAGPVVKNIQESFERFWKSPLSVPVEELLKKGVKGLTQGRIDTIYDELHAYADDPENYGPESRLALENMKQKFSLLLDKMVWEDIRFVSDVPGKNKAKIGLSGGGITTDELIKALKKAEKRITIQSPYLVMPKGGFKFFKELIDKGVAVRISTNSLAATDNIQAFSGYSKQRKKLLKTGIQVFEFRPDSKSRQKLIARYEKLKKESPVFAIHAKTLVIDGKTLYVGTFNFDPRSANLNTEIGVLINNEMIAGEVEKQIENDMLPENSWNAATEKPDKKSSFGKRVKVFMWKILPMRAIL